MRRPRPFSIGRVRVSPMRKPSKSDPRWYWRAKLYDAGVEVSVWSGRATRSEAEREVARLVAEDELEAPRDRRSTVAIGTIGELLDSWLEEQDERSDIRASTKANKHSSTRRIIRFLGAVRLDQIRQRTLDRYRDTLASTKHMRGDGYSTGSIGLDLQYLGEAWRWGQEIGVCTHELPSIRLRHRPVMPTNTPTHADVCEVVARVSPRWRPAIEILAATGARIGEIGTLRREDIHVDRGEITVHGKTGSRDVPARRNVLLGLPDGPGGIWGCTPRNAERMIRRQITAACEAAEIPRFTPHGLRRYAADRMVDSGVDLKTVADILGHSVLMLLKRYRQSTESGRRAAVRQAGLGDFGGATVLPMERRA
jgi:site-specific recombinase XerD